MTGESNDPKKHNRFSGKGEIPGHLKGCGGSAVWLLLIGIILAILLFQYKMGL